MSAIRIPIREGPRVTLRAIRHSENRRIRESRSADRSVNRPFSECPYGVPKQIPESGIVVICLGIFEMSV